jgi:EAL domain-containing protein (putative c-di-GMP-specific phosphodiesterase class I)
LGKVLILTKNKKLAVELKKKLSSHGLQSEHLPLTSAGVLEAIYREDFATLIADADLSVFPRGMGIDLLNSLGHRIPLIVLNDESNHREGKSINLQQISDQLTVLPYNNPTEIADTALMFLKHRQSRVKQHCQSIPYYNIQIPISMLGEFGGLGIITIDASSFSKIGLEYGVDVYTKLKTVFHNLLFDMWGNRGSFRLSDVICRKSVGSNVYYIFLNRSRETGALPLPGALEKIADRVAINIQNALWNELFASNSNRIIPQYVKSIPLAGVGFAGVLKNPCIDAHEVIDQGLEFSKRVAANQIIRVKERQRELMQTLIQSDEMLCPHFQAVFHLSDISEEDVREIEQTKSIRHLSHRLFGFESLIRVEENIIESKFKRLGIGGIDPKFLRPDVLFSLAKSSKVALELDQACLKLAANKSADLPGTLMINILPRNLYYIEKLKDVLGNRGNILFEVSESESISNFELMMKSCEFLETHRMGIAADDFGRGYSSLERIIKIRPNIIKFDRSMIQNVDSDPVKQAYVQGMVEAGKILGTLILAEGVETWEEARVLQSMGIDLIQGFLFHKPQRMEDILADLAQGGLSTVA